MASNYVYQDIGKLECNGNQNHPEENSISENITCKAEEYLQSDDVKFCSDPKLKKEKQKLEDLLTSYKNLISKLDSKFKTEKDKIAEEERLSKIPEIYAVLHPEIYRNSREEEKKKLAYKFSKRQFSPVDRVIPLTCRTPLMNISDKRGEEKDRFIKVLSNSPAYFLNTHDSPVTSKSSRRPCSLKLSSSPLNEREDEKERFIKLLSTSGTYYKNHLDQNSNSLSNRQSTKTKLFVDTEKPVKNSPTKKTMVRTEKSTVTSKQCNGTKEVEKKQHKPIVIKKHGRSENISEPSKHTSAKLDKALSTTDLGYIDEEDSVNIDTTFSGRKRCSSVSTQTEPSDVSIEEDIGTFEEDGVKSLLLPPTEQQKVHFLSPREKLMSDLHGVSRCFPGVSPNAISRDDGQDVKLRQAAYGKALQEQIKEKRNLEEAKRQKEKEEDSLIEHRFRLQQERIENEFYDEQRRKEDWLAQKQSHDEAFRRKFIEMELEAKQLKKLERRKRSDSYNELQLLPETLALVHSPRSTVSVPSDLSRYNTTGLRPTGNHDTVRMAPLLDANHQNVLSNFQHDYSIPTTSASRYVAGINYKEDKNVDKMRAEELLKAPIDFQIDRPPSPPLPAVHTRAIMNNNTKVLEEKWRLPKEGKELDRTQVGERGDNILTQLGAFRRQLHQEHVKLEARLQMQQTP